MAEIHRSTILARVASHHAKLSDVSIIAADGATLRAWYVEPVSPNGKAVVLFHGVTDTRAGVAGFGELFLDRGYAVLLPGLRHPGESGGGFRSFRGGSCQINSPPVVMWAPTELHRDFI